MTFATILDLKHSHDPPHETNTTAREHTTTRAALTYNHRRHKTDVLLISRARIKTIMYIHMTLLASTAAVVAASSSTEVDHGNGNSKQFGSYVNSLGLRALREAHSQALADRNLQGLGDGSDADLTDLMEGMESMFSLVCVLLNLGDELGDLANGMDSDLANEMDSNGVTCSQFGCDEANENLIMECASTDKICETDQDGVEYCIENATVSTTIEFDFDEPADLLSKQCWCPTSPPEMAAMGCSCFSVDLLIDYGEMMSTAGDHMMGTMTEEDTVAAMNANNYVQIRECAFVANGTDTTDSMNCECSICNDGLGVSNYMTDILQAKFYIVHRAP